MIPEESMGEDSEEQMERITRGSERGWERGAKRRGRGRGRGRGREEEEEKTRKTTNFNGPIWPGLGLGLESCDTLYTKQSNYISSAQKAKGWHKSVSCPEAVYKYNRYMGGVTRETSFTSHVRLNCQKDLYIFWFAFHTAITNAFVLSQCSVTTISQTHLQWQILEWCNPFYHEIIILD